VGATNEPAIVEYSTADGGAKAGIDYEAVSGSFTFAPASGRNLFCADRE
jgi:hypothetical protein